MTNPYRTQLEALLLNRANEIAKEITSGTCKTYEAYREKVGLLNGLQEAADFCVDAEKLMRESEE